MTSFSMHFEKRLRGLLREAFHSKGEESSGCKHEKGGGREIVCAAFVSF